MHNVECSISRYQMEADASCRPSRSKSKPSFLMLGLAGEIGSLLSAIKKKQRDSISFETYRDLVVEEFGDCLWYFSAICSVMGLSLREIANVESDSFSALQPQHPLPFAAPSTAFENTLIALFTKSGTLAGQISENGGAQVGSELIGLFALLLRTADEAGVVLAEIACGNLKKVKDRWPDQRVWSVDFDRSYPPHERLPNGLVVNMYERKTGSNTFVIQSSGDIFVGDRLTDNIEEGDDYRFHDVFHYAYASVLGWSPTTRALLKRKRKSETKIDEGQDSARAVIIEEGIATFIFGQAKKHDFFKHEMRGEMSFALLKQVRQFVEGFESEKCPLWLWEEAIFQGCEAFRFMRERRRGRLIIDRTSRQLRVEELKDDPDAVFG